MSRRHRLAIGSSLLVALVTSASAGCTQETAPAAPPLPVPSDQQRYLQAIDRFAKEYREQPNDREKSSVRRAREAELAKILPDAGVRDWVGVLDGVGTTASGKAYLHIRLSDHAWVGTLRDELSDTGEKTLVDRSSPIYTRLVELEKGTPVVFSGKLLRESSMSEARAMAEPQLVLRLADIRSLDEHQRSPAPAQPVADTRTPAAAGQAVRATSPTRAASSEPSGSSDSAPAKLDCNERRERWRAQGKPEWLIRESLASLGCR